MSQAIGEYKFKLILGYLVVMAMIGVFIQTTYRGYIDSILKLIFTEDYSYLLVTFLTITMVLYLSLRYMGFAYELQISRIVTSALLIVLSMLLYESSYLFPEYQVFLVGTSFSTMIVALLLIVFKPVSLSDVIPILTPLLMIPIPASFLDFLNPILSRLVGRVAAFITGTRFIETSVFAMIEVETTRGIYSFSVEAACSGILTISSVLVVFPLLAYYASISPDKPARKIKISLLALITGLLVGIIGNLVRVVLIILVAKYYDVELALNVFHYSPSIIYASISVLVSYAMIDRLAKMKHIVPRPLLNKGELPYVRWEYITGVLIFMVLVSMIAQAIGVVVARSGANVDGAEGIIVYVDSIESFISNPARYIFSGFVRVVGIAYDPLLTRVIGSIASYRVSFVVNNTYYFGFIELVDIPARLHTLQLCVTIQGYRVINAWGETLGALRIGYIYMEKDGIEYLLAYALVPIILRLSMGDQLIYARISLAKSVTGLGEYARLAGALLSAIRQEHEMMGLGTHAGNIFVLGMLGTALFTGLVIYILGIYLSSYLRKARMTRHGEEEIRP